MSFQLDSRLQQDCIHLGRFELCRLLLMNDSQYPWFILVPELEGIKEIHQLDVKQRQQLMEESCYLAENLSALYRPDKINIASLGNIVSQLHLHHVIRYQSDKAWPAPVWGAFNTIPYDDAQLGRYLMRLKDKLTACQFII